VNKNIKHIVYYTQKVEEHSRTYRNANRNQYRSARLIQYKKALNCRLRGGEEVAKD
jgi:hypothetical protein